jgi:hypothetical protein
MLRGSNSRQSCQLRHVIRRVRAEQNRRHFRRELPDDFDFRRVVIHKHKTVQAQVQFRGHGAEVLRFGLPIGLEANDVLQAQHHVRMFFKRFRRLGQIVLAAHGQQHAALFERGNVFLKRLERLAARRSVAQFDAFQTVIATTPPHSVLSKSSTRTFSGRA